MIETGRFRLVNPMASPFPGMDPYLEQPAFWSSFHSRLIVALADAIEVALGPEYYVEIEARTYFSEDDGGLLVGIPDAVVARDPSVPLTLPEAPARSPGIATQVSPQRVILPMPEEVTERYLEIRELRTGQVITALEVLSPKNKRPGQGRVVYEEKRRQVLGSLTNLVELDLLRGGEPMPMLGPTQPKDYQILVSASEQRPKAELYAFSLRDPLPSVPIPLLSTDTPIVLALQAIFQGVYERGRYQTRINYTQTPPPPNLPEMDQSWLNQLLQEKELR
jgi:hypothetical protein